MKIAIISDLHIGNAARAADLRTDENPSISESSYLERFSEFVESRGISCDYLIVAGDITNQAQFPEVELASTVIQRISVILSVERKCVFFVPGNHDRNWSLIQNSQGAPVSDIMQLAYSSLMSSESLFKDSIEVHASDGDYRKDPFIVRWEDENIIFLGANTAAHDKPDEEVHYGIIDESSIEHIASISASLRDDDRIKVFSAHHHPLQYSNPVKEKPDFSQMQNAQQLLEALNDAKIDILVHGHKHNPRLTPNLGVDGHPLIVVSAGSFSSLMPPDWSGVVSNQFHIIEVDKRCPDSACVLGRLRSWAYLYAHGWHESLKEHHGIDHVLGFGRFHDRESLKEKLSEVIGEFIGETNFCTKGNIQEKIPDLEYVNHRLARNCIEEIARESNCLVNYNSESEFIVFRRP